MTVRDFTTHIVRDGEYLDLIAFRYGWWGKNLWEHPCNHALRELREDPNVLAPGDVVKIPIVEREPVALRLATDNPFNGDVPTVRIRVRLLDGDGRPIAGERFLLEGMETPRDARTTDDGVAEFDPTLLAREVLLVLPQRGERITIQIGALDPASERSGQRQRLANLGYCAQEPSGGETSENELEVAMREFLTRNGVDPSGEVGRDPVEALTRGHAR